MTEPMTDQPMMTTVFELYMYQLGVPIPPGESYDTLRAGRLSSAEAEGVDAVRREEQGRQGRKQAGHYVAVIR